MNSRLQNLSEEVITDWPETKDPLVTTFNIKVIFIIINTNIIKVIGTIPNFANEKEPKRNFCGHVQPLLCFPYLNYISVQVDFYFFV